MPKQNTVEAVSARIDTLLKQKQEEIERIKSNIATTEKALSEARTKTRKATEKTDLKEYEAAKAEEEKALSALSMYKGRLSQIESQELVTDQESEKVINSLRECEKDLTRDFIKDLTSHNDELTSLLNKYYSELDHVEAIIKKWDVDIHTNYRAPGMIFNTGTDRSSRPVPLKVWMPCELSYALRNYLDTWNSTIAPYSDTDSIEKRQIQTMLQDAVPNRQV